MPPFWLNPSSKPSNFNQKYGWRNKYSKLRPYKALKIANLKQSFSHRFGRIIFQFENGFLTPYCVSVNPRKGRMLSLWDTWFWHFCTFSYEKVCYFPYFVFVQTLERGPKVPFLSPAYSKLRGSSHPAKKIFLRNV